MKELGKRIRARRERLGLTQRSVARPLGRTHSWLSAIEHGTGNPSAELLTALAVALSDDPAEYLRLAGRTVLRAEDIVPLAALDPRVSEAIEAAVARGFDRLVSRLESVLDRIAAQGAQ